MTLRFVAILCLFLASQYVAGLGAHLYVSAVYGTPGGGLDPALLEHHPAVLGTSLMISHAVLGLLLYALRWIPRRLAALPRPSAGALGATLLAAAGTLLAANIAVEWLALPDWQADTFRRFYACLPGFLGIVLTGPLIEELVFRQALMAPLLERGRLPWAVIAFSALVFGLIHANPAQSVAATVMGALLGWLFVRGGLLLPLAAHVFNNLLGVLSLHLIDEETASATLTDTIGLPATTALFAVSIGMAAGGIALLRRIQSQPS